MSFENVPCKATYSVKIGVWNDSQMMWDSFQTSALIQKNDLIYVSGTLYAHAGSSLRAHVERCVHKLIPTCACQAFPWFNFPKINLFAH